MRRRSLFAGLAGPLAAPKVAAAAASGGHPAHWLEIVGDTVEFDFVAGGVIAPGETITLTPQWIAAYERALPDGVEAIHTLPRHGASRLPVWRERDDTGRLAEVAHRFPLPAQSPIAVTWSGYTDELSAAPSPPEASALAGGGEGETALPPPAALSSGSFHAAQPVRDAASPASESHPEK